MAKGSGIIERSLLTDDQIMEFDNLVMDGIDISGRWNTMLKSRVHSRPELDSWDEIRESFIGASIDNCIQCGMCTAGCTVAHEIPEFNPRQFIYWVRTGRQDELIKNADVIWRCVGCYICTNHCPKEVNTAEVIESIGQWLHRAVPEKMDDAFKANHETYRHQLFTYGRLSLPRLQAEFLNRTGRRQELFTAEMRKTAVKMLKDGRVMRTLFIGKPRHWSRSAMVLSHQEA